MVLLDPMHRFLELTQPFLCSLQISIFVEPCDAPQSVQKTLTCEKLEKIKVMQTQHKLCPHSQTHLFPPLTLRLRLAGPHP